MGGWGLGGIDGAAGSGGGCGQMQGLTQLVLLMPDWAGLGRESKERRGGGGTGREERDEAARGRGDRA